jgi:hypothetical protein
MSGIETKGIIYYLIRRGWYGQLAALCQSSAGGGSGPRGGKGKGVLEPLLVYWRAFALSMMPANQDSINNGSSALQDARKILENSFQVNYSVLCRRRSHSLQYSLCPRQEEICSIL